MALSPQEVHDKQFKLVRQTTGYDMDEVDAFLERVEAEIARLTAELEAARRSAGAAPGAGGPQPRPQGAAEPAAAEAATRILELAQRTADEYVADARRTAQAMLAAAEQQAAIRVAALESQVAQLEGQVDSLADRQAAVRAHLTEYFHNRLRELDTALGGSAGEPGA